MKSMRTCRWSPALILGVAAALAALVWTAGRALGIGFVMSETKEALKLKYDVAVQDHGTGRVTVVLTLADEGRLKPLDEVQFVIPAREKNADGSNWMDLVVAVDMQKANDGTRVGRVHVLKDWAERGQIQLNTHTLDGKMDPMTRLHHVIPLAKHMAAAPAKAPTAAAGPAPAASPAATPAPAAPPATERK